MLELRLKDVNQKNILESFFSEEVSNAYLSYNQNDTLKVKIDDSKLSVSQRFQLKFHLKYSDLFEWYNKEINE